MDNILTFIGLMKRAGALAIGAEGASDCAARGHAKIFLLASDASENTRRAVENAAGERGTFISAVKYTKRELGAALGQQECAALAVADAGFARALAQRLGLSVQIRAPRPKNKNQAKSAALGRRKAGAAQSQSGRAKGQNKGDRI